MIFCTRCGKQLLDDAIFCTACGIRVAPVRAPEEADEMGHNAAVTFTPLQAAVGPVESMPEEMPAPPPAIETEPVVITPPPVIKADAMEQPLAIEAEPAVLEPMAADDPPAIATELAPMTEQAGEDMPRIKLDKDKLYAPLASDNVPRVSALSHTGLGLIYAALLIAAAYVLTRLAPGFYDIANLYSGAIQTALLAALAMGVAITTRAKGPDLSAGAVIALAITIIAQTMTRGGSLTMGILLALSAGLIIGLINGLMAVYLKIHSVIITLVTAVIIGGINGALLWDQTIAVSIPDYLKLYLGAAPIGSLVLLGAVFLFSALLILFSKLGVPRIQRDKDKPAISYLLAYLASPLIAVLVGVVMIAQSGAAMPGIASGYEVYLLFVFAMLELSRATDNRFVPALFALIPALIWGVLTNVMTLWGVITYFLPIVYGGLTLVSLLVGYLCRIERKARIQPLRTASSVKWPVEEPDIFSESKSG